jgi:hypothetical protein
MQILPYFASVAFDLERVLSELTSQIAQLPMRRIDAMLPDDQHEDVLANMAI